MGSDAAARVLHNFEQVMDERDWPAHDVINVADALDIPASRLLGDA